MQVHIILGIGHFEHNLTPNETGVMGDVAASPSDPIFINHHGMVDCILEEWLQKNRNAQYPQNPVIRPGHRKNDYTVPFFPVVTHGEVFKTADNFGYSCSLPPNVPNPPDTPNAAIKLGSALWLFVLVILGGGFFI